MKKKSNKYILVSFTTTSYRIKYISDMIKSIIEQSYKPDEFILNISKSPYSDMDKGISNIPQSIKEYVIDGYLKINYSNTNYGSFTKLCPTLKEHFNRKETVIITVDDDFIYPKYAIENLLKTNELYPNHVCSHTARSFEFDNIGYPRKYRDMTFYQYNSQINNKYLYIVLGGLGALYEINYFDKEIFNHKEREELSKFEDDIWISANLVRNKIPLRLVYDEKTDFIKDFKRIDIPEKFTLYHSKNKNGNSDKVIKNLAKYFKTGLTRQSSGQMGASASAPAPICR